MTNPLKWGQGPRPDLLEEQLLRRAKEERKQKEVSEALQPGEGEAPEAQKAENRKNLRKDRFAMMVALFSLLAPWILGGIALYFLVVFLIYRFS